MFSICYMLIDGDYIKSEANDLVSQHGGYLPDPLGKYEIIC